MQIKTKILVHVIALASLVGVGYVLYGSHKEIVSKHVEELSEEQNYTRMLERDYAALLKYNKRQSENLAIRIRKPDGTEITLDRTRGSETTTESKTSEKVVEKVEEKVKRVKKVVEDKSSKPSLSRGEASVLVPIGYPVSYEDVVVTGSIRIWSFPVFLDVGTNLDFSTQYLGITVEVK